MDILKPKQMVWLDGKFKVKVIGYSYLIDRYTIKTAGRKWEVEPNRLKLNKMEKQINNQPKTITWQELKDFVNSIELEFLNEALVIEVADSNLICRLEPFRVKNDFYMNREDSEDVGTLDELKEIKDSNNEPFNIDDYVLLHRKGSPILSVELIKNNY